MDKPDVEPIVAGLKRAFVHFSKAAIEVASGLGDVVQGVARTMRPEEGDDGSASDRPQKIDIE